MASDTELQVVESPGPYIYFVLGAFAITLIGGPLVGALLWMSRSGFALAGRQEALVQAHGWTQLLGWAGLFVAGFSLRLLPRFAGRPERPAPVAISLLAALVAGVVLRAVGEVAGGAWSWVAAAGGLLAAAGMVGVALSMAATLRENRHSDAPWAMLASFGAAWWAVGAGLSLVTSISVAVTGVVPSALDRSAVWVLILGAIGNFIWAVQSRMMPTSFGRRPVSRRSALLPAVAYNLGAALVLASIVAGYPAGLPDVARTLSSLGLGIAGAAMVWLTAVCGSLGGKADRLRPASRPLGRFIVWANRWAVLAGALLVLWSLRGVLPPAIAEVGLDDASLHAVATGLITILIAGMLQLVAPVFAMERMGRPRPARLSLLVWGLLMVAAVTRVAAALASTRPGWFDPLAGASALTGWLGLALLAGTLLRTQFKNAPG